MGLSAAESKEKLTTYQALLEIAASLKELAANPNIKQLSKDAFALPAQDQAKAQEGRDQIAAYLAAIQEQKNRDKELQVKSAELDSRESALASAKAELAGVKITLDKKQREMEAKEEALAGVSKDLALANTSLADGNAKLKEGLAALKIAQREVAEEKSNLQARAEQVKALVG